MSKEKQIEEMACDMCNACDGLFTTECEEKPCWDIRTHAELLYNAGYRKQSEGKWKDGKCSVCGSKMPIKDDGKGFRWHISDYNAKYCPECGARMKGGAEQ